jgi:predicted dehydrogenase
MLKVGIVGCGKIADAHVSQIQRIKGCEIVGVCDREPLMARQLHERFPIRRCYGSVDELVDDARPDVVHITTPPQSHYDLARRCLESGTHVYVEKPFTLDAREAASLLTLAGGKGLKVTVGHDDQFTHVARRMRQLVRDGWLGGSPTHMDSCYCYDISEPRYARALLGDRQHWVRRLPGKLLQNIISHGIARIAEFLTTDMPHVIAYGFVSPLLKRLDERDIIDELRVIVAEEDGPTAYFTFSSQMRPCLHQFRLYGPKNGLILDHDQDSLLVLRGKRYKSYGEKFLPHLAFARQHVANFATNLRTFAARDFQMKSGMKFLIESFYRSIAEDAPVPIPYREIQRTATIMDAIFHQLAESQGGAGLRHTPDAVPATSQSVPQGAAHTPCPV